MLAWHTQLKLSKEKDTQIRRQKLNRWTGTSHFLAAVVLPRTGSAWTEFAKEVEEMLKGVYKKKSDIYETTLCPFGSLCQWLESILSGWMIITIIG